MMKIDIEFARRDDCLDQMVPSDLRLLVSERDQLRAELAALKAGQGEAVAEPYAWFWSHGSDQGVLTLRQDYEQHLADYPGMVFTAVYTAPPASADAVSVARGLERAIQIVREVAKTQPGYSDEREAIFEALSDAYVEAMATQPPGNTADARLVPVELLERIMGRLNTAATAFKATKSERDALRAQVEAMRELLAGVCDYADGLLTDVNRAWSYCGSTGADEAHKDADYLAARAALQVEP